MKLLAVIAIAALVAPLSACKRAAEAEPVAATPAAQAAAQPSVAPANAQPNVVVYKNATCGCCALWVDHLRAHGFPVEVHDVDNMSPVKERVGVPPAMGSCHTAEVGGYFIEGHVPAADIQRLLEQKPDAKGLTVPGMPIGSPGMEQGDRADAYDVYLVNRDGTTSVYASYPARPAQ
jgi:hypothetical protein